MRFIKLVLISAVVLFGIITAIASLLPSQVRISRAVDIDASPAALYPRLADVKTWEGWNEFVRQYHHVRAAQDTLAADEMTVAITRKTDSLLTSAWKQAAGYQFSSGYRIIGYAHDSARCTVQWYFDFHVRWYPWEKFQSIVFDQQLGPVKEKSLQNLKRQAESR